MRKTYLGALLLAGTLAFTACQNETIIYLDENGNPIENVELKEGEGILKINLSNTSANSRAARPVGSSAAANIVNTVKVHIYSKEKDGDYAVDNTISLKSTDESNNITLSGGVITIKSTKGQQEDHTNDPSVNHEVAKVSLKGLDSEKTYKFIAVGYNASDNETSPYAYGSSSPGGIFTTTSSKTGYEVEELFSGEVESTGPKATITVNMERQIAGMLAYFKNVPATINNQTVDYIKIFASANTENTNFEFPSSEDFNGAGTTNTSETLLMSFHVSDIKKGEENGYYTFYTMNEYRGDISNKKAPLADGYIAPTDLQLEANSIFGGRYIIPYANTVDANTLVIKFYNGTSTVLKTLNVTTNASGYEGNNKKFDIKRNNFYSIGQKLETDTTTPTEPGEPDKPIDLSGNTDIVVTINDAWKVLHNMGVEE